MDLVIAAAESYANRAVTAPANRDNCCMTIHMVTEVLWALDVDVATSESAQSADVPPTHTQNVGVDVHIEYVLGLAQRGLIPKVFWWCTPEVLAILDGWRRVAAAAGERAEAAMEDALLRCFEYAILQVVEAQRSDLFPLVHKFSCVNKALAAAARAVLPHLHAARPGLWAALHAR